VIVPRVIAIIRSKCPPATKNAPISEDTLLSRDLGFGQVAREALAPRFTELSQQYGGSRVLAKELSYRRIVRSCIDLVHGKLP
jgi:hypothetical protein